MQKLTDLSSLTFKVRQHASKVAPVYAEVATLNIGESLLVQKADWTLKHFAVSAYSFPKSLRTDGRKYRCLTLADDSGFVITRTA